MAQSYSVTAVLSAVDRGFSSTMDKAATATKSLGTTVQEKMSGIGKAVTIAGAATTAMGVSALKGYGTFEQSLNQAAVIAGGTAKDIDGLADVANRMGAELPLSAQDAADAMVAMARDGASINTIKKEFPAIAKAATAAGADLQTTASVVQQSMNIWGDSLKSPEQAAGILVQVANQSNASIESMQEALASVGPTAANAGYSMQDTANAIGLLTNKGMSSARAADNLNHAIIQMQSPTKKSREYMEQLGISFRDSEGKMKPIPQIAGELSQALKGLGKEQQDTALKVMLGQDGMRVMQNLMRSVADETDNTATSWNAASKAIEKYAGSTEKSNKNLDKQAVEMQKNIGSSLEQLGGSWDNLVKKSMSGAKKINGSYIGMANKAVDWATKSNSAIAQATRGFIGLSPVIGSAMTAVGGFLTNAQKIGGALSGGISATKAFGSGVSTFMSVSKALIGVAKGSQAALLALQAMANTSKIAKAGLIAYNAVVKVGTAIQVAFNAVMALNPFILIGVAIAAVIAVLVLFFTKTKLGQQIWQGFVSWLSNAWNTLKELASVVWNTISEIISSVVEKIKPIWNTIVEFFSNLWNTIVTIATNTWNSFVEGVAPIIESFKNLWNSLVEFFSVLWEQIIDVATPIWNVLVIVITTVWEQIKMIVQAAITILSSIIQAGLSVIQAVWSAVWDVIVALLTTIWDQAKIIIQTALSVISTIIQTAMSLISTIWNAIWNTIVNIVSTVWNIISTVISTVINVIANIIKAVTAAIKGDWTGVWEAIKSIVSTIWDGIKAVVTTAINGVSTAIRIVLNAIKSIWSAVWNSIKDVISSVWDGIKSLVSTTLNGISSIISSIMNGIKDVIFSIMDGIRNVFSTGWETITRVTREGINRAYKAVKSIAGNMLSAGKDFVMGFVRGIKGAIGSAVKVATDMAKSAFDAAKRALGINSPSRVMRDKVGKWVPAGLAVGIMDNLSDIEKASDKMAQASMFSIPPVNTHDFANSIATMNGQLTGSVSGDLTHELSINQQPAYINVSLGGTDYGAFVADISREQGSQASLTRNYKF
ncbi:phage tail tape measure protein [Ligilactobacillus murinus]|uniref:Phage tail tape measure protein n=1 Tax=Ligilactobacillus murinus TaxID=1622 RepID=A0AAE6WGM2_9LACO|nr:phage tail tape measure protein [Ligilactobacillus murinus]NEF81966.1 phage tail tape measure protein [Ligilactobacillus murinus]NEF84290.1 phage tail tape measure protein [Ligilactobacillus murinus]NEF86510.1 phage tail tape measure protein [Ligilactobacillus murinus]NEF88907.1 phage tail tape measure protein [Ligilactobacillus murinus]NEF91175.1 phage tail tape measure protein [Ligilactobacillus murinus]